MRLIILSALVALANAQSGSLECYDGWNNGEQVQVVCKCDVDEMSQFISHVGKVCFGDGTIPQEIDEYFDFGDGCNQYGNNNNNNDEDACEEETQLLNFWCGCLSSYLKKYGSFSEGCWIPNLSEAMREISGGSMESAWDRNGCEWWEYKTNRVLPNDISVSIGGNSESCVVPTPTPAPKSSGSGSGSGSGAEEEDGGGRRLQDGGSGSDTADDIDCSDSGSSSALGTMTLGATQDETTGAIVSEEFSVNLDYTKIKAAYLAATGNQLQCGRIFNDYQWEYEEYEDGETLAWEIRRGWVFDDDDTSKGSATRYGAACGQEYTGEVLVTYAYAATMNEYGTYVEEEDGEPVIFIGDLTQEESYGPLYVSQNDMTSIQYPRPCDNGNNNGNNNGNDYEQECEGQSQEGNAEGNPSLAQALSYLLYNPSDVDMYSIVISCGGENDLVENQNNNNNNNNNNNDEDACDDDNNNQSSSEKELCESKAEWATTKWATPILCSNFFVASDQIVDVDDPAEEGGEVCKGLVEENDASCQALVDEDECGSDERCEWVSAGGDLDNITADACKGKDAADDSACALLTEDGQTGCEADEKCAWNEGSKDGGGEELNAGDDEIVVSQTADTIKTVAIIVLAVGCVALCFLWSCGKKKSYESVEEGASARDTTPLRDDQL